MVKIWRSDMMKGDVCCQCWVVLLEKRTLKWTKLLWWCCPRFYFTHCPKEVQVNVVFIVNAKNNQRFHWFTWNLQIWQHEGSRVTPSCRPPFSISGHARWVWLVFSAHTHIVGIWGCYYMSPGVFRVSIKPAVDELPQILSLNFYLPGQKSRQTFP